MSGSGSLFNREGDFTVKIWDTESGAERCTLSGHTNWVKTVAVFADGARVVSGSGSLFNREGDFTVKIWDTESGAERCTLSGHSRMVTAVAVFPDDKRVVSGSGDKTVKIWTWNLGICCVQCQAY